MNVDGTPGRVGASRLRSSNGSLASAWRAARWPLLAALAVASFVLGFVGFRSYFDGAGFDKSTLDVVYVTLQLYTLESGSVPETGAPWELEVARLAAPAFSATALITALAIAFRRLETEFADRV